MAKRSIYACIVYICIFFSLLLCSAKVFATNIAIYPLDRATILAGSPFDFKVEFSDIINPESMTITVNGQDYHTLLSPKAHFLSSEKDAKGQDLGSALIMRQAVLTTAGTYEVKIRAGQAEKTVQWQVYSANPTPKIKNIIFFLGDGMSIAHRTAARIMSKGMENGKINARLNMDSFERMAFIGTSSTGSIATDSANTMSAYMTGHKSATKALGVYADRTENSLDDPRVETMGEALRRCSNKSFGIVTTTEVEDATAAAGVSHTRNRDDKAEIVSMLFEIKPEIVLGGGSSYFLPNSIPGSKRKDAQDYIQKFRDEGYRIVTTKTELDTVSAANPSKILGLFHTSHLDTVLDRKQLKMGTVKKFPDQPGLVDMTRQALNHLSKNPAGFFLIIEGGLIDKMSHQMDWDRALYETIEFDQAIGLALEFSKQHPDSLILVTSDHAHGVSLIGTINDQKPGPDMREKIGVYDKAAYPNYEDSNGDGFPDSVNVSSRLALFANNFPDHYETFRPKNDGPFVPAIQNEKREYIANEIYKTVPGAIFRAGNIPRNEDTAAHAVDDVILQATGPNSEYFKAYMEQSDVYIILANLLGFGHPCTP